MTAKTPSELASDAAEAICDLNYLTLWPGQEATGLAYPGDAYATVAGLKALAQRLPQTFTQMRCFLEALYADGHFTADHGDVTTHTGHALEGLHEAGCAAAAMASALDRAHTALGPLGYQHLAASEPDDEDACEAKFIDGSWHLCGCQDCQQLAADDPDGSLY